MNTERHADMERGLAELPVLSGMNQPGRNGEELATDEAAVWKRVLNYRLARWLKPGRILETHAGLSISTVLYQHASPASETVSLAKGQTMPEDGAFDLIDVDPFGAPWKTLTRVRGLLAHDGVMMVSNGEALAVWRNLRRQQAFPTEFYGKRMPRWVRDEYLERVSDAAGVPVRWFYAFPTTIRVVLSNRDLPDWLWDRCPQWMWWLRRYA